MEQANTFEANFESFSAEQWKEKLAKDLKGKTFDDLVKVDRNGIEINPFFTKEDQIPSLNLNLAKDWDIVDNIIVEDVKSANALALHLLNNGASGLRWELSTAVDFDTLLQDIDLRYISSHFIFSSELHAEKALKNYLEKNYADQALALFIENGAPYLCFDYNDNKTLHVNAAVYNNSGCNAVNEVAFILAQVEEAFVQCAIQQLTSIHLNVAVDTMYFEQLSKMRAIRLGLNFLMQHRTENPIINIFSESSQIYLTQTDVASNLLRNTVSGMAAALGGAVAVFLYPFTKEESRMSLSKRMARNQQLLMQNESYLHFHEDIAKGAYFIEYYTQQIAEKAWDKFKEVEKAGGWNLAKDDLVLKTIKIDAAALVDLYRRGERMLIGVNKYQPKAATSVTKKEQPQAFGIEYINIEQELM